MPSTAATSSNSARPVKAMSFAIAPAGLPRSLAPVGGRGSRHSTVVVSLSQKQRTPNAAVDASKSASVKQALLALSASVPGLFVATAAWAADNDAATESLRPLDYVILLIPTLAYGLFYLQREQKDVRVRVALGSAASPDG